MAMTDKVRTIFADARSVYADALERLDSGDIRDAAEKTCAPPSVLLMVCCWR